MKKILSFVVALALLVCFVGCGDSETIKVGATPSPHAEILNIEAVKTYIESKGYKLKVVVYQDYVTMVELLLTISNMFLI